MYGIEKYQKDAVDAEKRNIERAVEQAKWEMYQAAMQVVPSEYWEKMGIAIALNVVRQPARIVRVESPEIRGLRGPTARAVFIATHVQRHLEEMLKVNADGCELLVRVGDHA